MIAINRTNKYEENSCESMWEFQQEMSQFCQKQREWCLLLYVKVKFNIFKAMLKLFFKKTVYDE